MRLYFLSLFCFFLQLSVHAQERVRNVHIRVLDSASLDIRYDLLTTRPGDSIYLQMRSRLRGSIRILPEFVRGDIGTGITAGTERHIYWDALANGYSLNEEVQARVIVKTGTLASRTQPIKKEPVVVQAPTVTPTESKTVTSKPDESVGMTTPKRPETTPPSPVAQAPTKQPKRTQPTKPSVFAMDSATTATPAPTKVTITPTQPSASTSVVATTPAPAPTSETALQPQAAVVPSSVATPDTVLSRKVHHRYTGPAWALLSAVAPGIGNIFVQTPKPKVGLRPLLTVLCYGAIAYGLSEKQKADDTYAIYVQQKNLAEGEPYYQTANNHYHRYYLATRGAVIVAAADVVLTFIKGLRNSQLEKNARRTQGVTLRPGWLAGQPTAVLRYSF